MRSLRRCGLAQTAAIRHEYIIIITMYRRFCTGLETLQEPTLTAVNLKVLEFESSLKKNMLA